MSRHGSRSQPWDEDPAKDVIDELTADFEREMELDVPTTVPNGQFDGQVGHIVEDDLGMGSHEESDFIGTDSHDFEGLSAEELAMHVMSDAEIEGTEDPEFATERTPAP